MDWGRFRGSVDGADGRVEYPTDARPIDDHPRHRGDDPDAGRRRTLRRRGRRFALATLFTAGSVAALFGEGGYLDHRRLRSEVATLHEAIAAEQARVDALEREVHALEHDPLARERIAREQLGLVRPGELDFLLPPEPHGAPPPAPTRRRSRP